MAETDSPAQYHPAFWFRRGLLLPLAAGGLFLVGLELLGNLLLFQMFDPFLTDVPENQRWNYLTMAEAGWDFSVISIAYVTMRLVTKHVDSETSDGSGISLVNAMCADKSYFVWWLSILIVGSLAISALVTVPETSPKQPGMPLILYFASFPMLSLVGSAVKRAQPELWSQIQAHGAAERRSSLTVWALLLFGVALYLFVEFSFIRLAIWSLFT